MPPPGKSRIAAHVEVEWTDAAAEARCPNCGTAGQVRRLLEIDYRPPGAAHHFGLQVCPHCGARFADNPETMDYGTDELIEIGWHTYQIQLGAGVWPIAAPLTRIDKPAGARMLEIGGAYGFGLDFGIRGRGWTGVGYDPSPLAAFGARELGLQIRQAYFGEADLAGAAFDVVLATEVVEHLADPPAFFQLMRRAAGTNGILLLTTPDAAWITPELPPAQLMPLLSPGAHLVLQTEQSLALALTAAGFAHVRVRREAMSLIAYASPAAFTLSDDAAAGRSLYRRYLVERAALAAPASDLRLGFAGRGLFEAANDGDAAPAAAAWAALLPAVRERFGLDLENITVLPAAAAGASLAALARVMPLGLGMILFGRAMQRLADGESRANLLALFRLAIAAIDALQDALAQRSLRDGLSAELRRVAAVECLICQADAGQVEAVPALVALAREDPAQIIAAWRGLVGLVNAGAYAAATELQQALRLDDPAALPVDLRHDALLSLVNLALAPGGATLRAFDYAAALGGPAALVEPIILQAFTRLVNAGRFAEARDAAARYNVAALAARGADVAAADARLAMIMLDFGLNQTRSALERLRMLLRTAPTAALERLFVESFVRLVNEGDHAAALPMQDEVERHLVHCDPALRENALAALLLLQLHPGGEPARLPARVEALAAALPDEDRLRDLVFAAFVTLVNRGDPAAGRLRQRTAQGLAKLHPPYRPGERDALFAFGILALQEKDDMARGVLALSRLRDDIIKHTASGAAPDGPRLDGPGPDGLFWPALRGEVLTLNELDRREEAAALVADMAARFAGAPDDLLALLPPAPA